jgi:hypothetical protein
VPLLAAGVAGLHLATAGGYGIFRDELYYIACARHLAWGYVDHPPLIALITWAVIHTAGTSLLALRLLPAVASAALAMLTAQLARAFGGGRFAQGFAAFAVIPVPIYLVLNHWLTMNAFEPLIWTGLAWAAIRAIRLQDGRYWLLAGLMLGVGLENKYSVVFCAAALLPALALTKERYFLSRPHIWAAVGIAALLFLPNLIWLISHDFPFLEFERHSRLSGSRRRLPPVGFIADQLLMMNPLLAPLWLGGLAWLLADARGRRYRPLGLQFLAIFAILLILQAKNYYLAPAYPVVLAAGAVALEQMTRRGRRWMAHVYGGVVLASGLIMAPLLMPILSAPDFLRYRAALGGLNPVVFERLDPHELPQYFADEFGWRTMAQRAADAYFRLPEAERTGTAIFANNYGEAAAIDFFGPALGLPPAISNAQTYWLWGPRAYTGKTVLVLGSNGDGDRAHFRSVETAGRVETAYARRIEQFDIFLCRDLTTPGGLADLWPQIRNW